MKKRCVFYIRTSNLEATGRLQHDELHAYAKQRGWQVVAVYEDHGQGPKRDRKGLEELLGAAGRGRFDFVVIWRLDRMFASAKHLTHVLQELEIFGIGLVSVLDEINTLGPEGGLIARLFRIFGHLESRIFAERVQAGLEGSKRRGAFFGHKKKIDLQTVLTLMDEGYNQKEIAKRLKCSAAGISKSLRNHRMLSPPRASGE